MSKYMNRGKSFKGEYKYIESQRKRVILRTALLFGISLALLAIGIWSAGDKRNMLTVVAVLGCLPASKSAVNMIIFLRARGCSQKVWEQVQKHSQGLSQLWDLVFTSYDKNYQVSHMAVKGNVILGITEDPGCDARGCESHLDTYLKQGGCRGAVVKIYQDVQKYCEALENLKKQETDPDGQAEEIVENLIAIAL
ncbi:MAG: hypothetical protein ACI4D5_05625 [Kineothrix sp.]